MPGRGSERANRAEECKRHGERGKRKRKIRYTDENDTSYAVTPAHASLGSTTVVFWLTYTPSKNLAFLTFREQVGAIGRVAEGAGREGANVGVSCSPVLARSRVGRTFRMSLFLTRQVPWMFCLLRNGDRGQRVRKGEQIPVAGDVVSSSQLQQPPPSVETGERTAADWETMSTSLPSRMISSFWVLDSEMVTPSSNLMLRTRFSPRKLLSAGERGQLKRGLRGSGKRKEKTHRISTDCLSSAMMTLIGKWA